MTFNVIGEVLNIITTMKMRLEKLYKALIEYDRFFKVVKWFYDPQVRNNWYIEIELSTIKLNEQQEHDGENTNLVLAGNESDKEDMLVYSA